MVKFPGKNLFIASEMTSEISTRVSLKIGHPKDHQIKWIKIHITITAYLNNNLGGIPHFLTHTFIFVMCIYIYIHIYNLQIHIYIYTYIYIFLLYICPNSKISHYICIFRYHTHMSYCWLYIPLDPIKHIHCWWVNSLSFVDYPRNPIIK